MNVVLRSTLIGACPTAACVLLSAAALASPSPEQPVAAAIAISSETPVWSPDGRRIVFSAGPTMEHQIYVMNVDGSGARRLTEGAQNRWPTWSPDGKSIAFMSDRDGQGELYVMKPDGSEQRRLTNSAVHEFAPAWSPRGDVIICFAEMPRAKQQILRVSPRDGQTQRIDGDHLYYGRPAWLRDGTKFLVAAHRDSATAPADRWKVPTRIYAMSPDGATITAITGDGQDTNPWPSPDDRMFVFDTGDGSGWASDRGQWDLWTLSLSGGRRTRLTSGDTNDWGAAWSPDGKQIVFCSGSNRVYALHLMSSDGTGRRALTRTDRYPVQP